jgi:dynactin-4
VKQYTFQLAFTNPLYDPIQIRLTQPHFKSASPSTQQVLVHIPTPHFTINALKDAWAYDEEEEDYDGEFEGTEATSEDGPGSLTGTGTGSGGGTLGRKARLNVLAGGGERDKVREKKDGFERKGNVSKVGLELEVLPEAKGDVQVSLARETIADRLERRLMTRSST